MPDPIDRFARGNRELKQCEHWTPLSIGVNAILTGNPPQALRRLIPNGKDLGNDHRMRLLR
jgi:hypothetical protein